MKILFTTLWALCLLIQTSAYAEIGVTTVYAPNSLSVNPIFASPLSEGQTANQGTLLNGSNQKIEYETKQILTDNDATVSIGYANGMFYANGILLGPSYKTSSNFGTTLINGIPLKQYNFNRTHLGEKTTKKTKKNPLYFRAYTKFLLEDYKGAIEDCNLVLQADSSDLQASLMKTVAQFVLDKKTTSVDAQSKIDKILSSSE